MKHFTTGGEVPVPELNDVVGIVSEHVSQNVILEGKFLLVKLAGNTMLMTVSTQRVAYMKYLISWTSPLENNDQLLFIVTVIDPLERSINGESVVWWSSSRSSIECAGCMRWDHSDVTCVMMMMMMMMLFSVACWPLLGTANRSTKCAACFVEQNWSLGRRDIHWAHMRAFKVNPLWFFEFVLDACTTFDCETKSCSWLVDGDASVATMLVCGLKITFFCLTGHCNDLMDSGDLMESCDDPQAASCGHTRNLSTFSAQSQYSSSATNSSGCGRVMPSASPSGTTLSQGTGLESSILHGGANKWEVLQELQSLNKICLNAVKLAQFFLSTFGYPSHWRVQNDTVAKQCG